MTTEPEPVFYAEGEMPVEAILLRGICERTPVGEADIMYLTDHALLRPTLRAWLAKGRQALTHPHNAQGGE